FKEKIITFRKLFICGIIVGILFSLLLSQGYYIFILFSAGLLFTNYLHFGISVKSVKRLLLQFIFFLLGTCFGLVPFIIYLISTNSFYAFIDFYVHLSDIIYYAKTPFIPYSASKANIFIFCLYIVSLFYVAYIILSKKSKTDLK